MNDPIPIRRYNKEDYAFLSPVKDIIEDAKAGRMFILVDSESRENEGDLIIPAQMATPDIINFMAIHARGLICLALTQERADALGLQLMPPRNHRHFQTAFTVSIEAREGVTTGISAHDRARTIAVAIDPEKNASDIATPGHVFPILAREGGVLTRAGHTEAVIDIARLAGLYPAAVICEIMKEDGTMARLPDLIAFAQKHHFKIGAISELIAHRRRHDTLIRRAREGVLKSEYGGTFQTITYESLIDHTTHAALIKGNISDGKPVLTRVHVANIAEDMLGQKGKRHLLLQKSMEIIAKEKRGVLVLLHPSEEADYLMEGQADHEGALVEYGAGAQILLDLGIQKMILLTDSQFTLVGLEGFSLQIKGQRPILGKK